MAYGSVHVPAGCTVKVGDSIGSLTDLGVLKGDAAVEVTYDLVEVLGSKAEEVMSYAKNMKAAATAELYQLHLPYIQKVLDGVATVTSIDGTPVTGYSQVVSSGAWSYEKFIPFDKQHGTGAKITPTSVTGSVDGALVLDTDYFVMKNEQGIWGLYVIDSTTVTTEAQNITIVYDYTPAVSKTLKMGAASAQMVAKIVEFSKTVAGKVFRVRLWSAKNETGITLAFPNSDTDEPASLPLSLSGRLDATKATGEQLLEVYDEIGITV